MKVGSNLLKFAKIRGLVFALVGEGGLL